MKTQITFVLDSSGSMEEIAENTKSGYNRFLREQREEPGTATVTLYEFDTDVELVYRNYPIADAPELTDDNYTPSGRTALHDAIYRAVTETVEEINGADPSERPDNVVFVVLTDGKENASETHPVRVREQVEIRREEDGMEFLFIGANQDAALTAESLGIHRGKSLDMAHSGDGAEAAYESTSERVSEVRRDGRTDGFEEADRQRQEDAQDP